MASNPAKGLLSSILPSYADASGVAGAGGARQSTAVPE